MEVEKKGTIIEIINKSIYEEFKELIGKYLYYEVKFSETLLFSFYLIKEVKIVNGEAKIKLSYYDYKKDCYCKGGKLKKILNLNRLMKVVDKKDIKKILVLNGLQNG